MNLEKLMDEILNLCRDRGYDDMRQKLLMLKDEIEHYSITLEKEKSSFSKIYPIKQNMRYQKNVGYFVKLEDGSEDGPYCPSCWETKGKLIHLKEELCKDWDSYKIENNEKYYDHYSCPNDKCGNRWFYNYDIDDSVRQGLEKKKMELSKDGEQND